MRKAPDWPIVDVRMQDIGIDLERKWLVSTFILKTGAQWKSPK